MSNANQLKNLKDKFNFAEYKFENATFKEEEQTQFDKPDLKIVQVTKTFVKTSYIFLKLLASVLSYCIAMLVSTLEITGKSFHRASEYIAKNTKSKKIKTTSHNTKLPKSFLVTQTIPNVTISPEELDFINEERFERELYIDSYICTLVSSSGSKSNCFIETEIDDICSLKQSIHFNAEILMVINEKMLGSKLITNVENIEILVTTSNTNKSIEMEVTYRLNKNGLTWSTIFSKYIMTGLSMGLAPIGGNIIASFRNDIGFKLEQFSMKIEYPILQKELSFKSSQVSFVEKIKKIDTSRRYEEKKC